MCVFIKLYITRTSLVNTTRKDLPKEGPALNRNLTRENGELRRSGNIGLGDASPFSPCPNKCQQLSAKHVQHMGDDGA